jgi:hypothetical protein
VHRGVSYFVVEVVPVQEGVVGGLPQLHQQVIHHLPGQLRLSLPLPRPTLRAAIVVLNGVRMLEMIMFNGVKRVEMEVCNSVKRVLIGGHNCVLK